MGIVTGHSGMTTMTTQGLRDALPSSSPSSSNKKRWWNLMPLFVAIVVVVEIAFLGHLDVAKNAVMVRNWTANTFYNLPLPSHSSSSSSSSSSSGKVVYSNASSLNNRGNNMTSCEDWLEKEDSVSFSRCFHKDPVWVSGADQEWKSCSVGCRFGFNHPSGKKPDGAFGLLHDPVTASVLRSMESSQYYAENNLGHARRRGYNVVMTTSLSSDVPVGYFSWAEYDIMAPMHPKSENALAAAFISNCGARNFRLQALDMLETLNVKIDSYGGCHRNRDGRVVDKVEALKRYKFSLAFENSNEEDYVTEKFFQSLVAGAVPVVVGAPNIQDFAPTPGSILHIKELNDVSSVAKTMKHLAENPDAFNQSIRWKYEGPSDSFKALVDMAAVHSSCRLCIHLATKIREREERSVRFKKRPCKCARGAGTVYHLYVRERGRFDMESIFLRSRNLTLKALEFAVLSKFKSLNHVPIWKKERPDSIRGGDELKIYRIYPVGITRREALYSFQFHGDNDVRRYVESNPCAKLEVIFV